MYGIFLSYFHVQLHRRRRHGTLSTDSALIYPRVEHHCCWLYHNSFPSDRSGTCQRRNRLHRQDRQTIGFPLSDLQPWAQLFPFFWCRLGSFTDFAGIQNCPFSASAGICHSLYGCRFLPAGIFSRFTANVSSGFFTNSGTTAAHWCHLYVSRDVCSQRFGIRLFCCCLRHCSGRGRCVFLYIFSLSP